MALGNKHGDFFSVVDFVREQSGHEFDRVICLQISGPVGNVAVAGGVGFVESVTGEHLDFLEDLIREFGIDAVGFLRAFNEF